MMPNRTYELRTLYFQQSNYNPQPSESYEYPSLLQWPKSRYFTQLQPDAELLRETLLPPPVSQESALSDQVFGRELRQQNFSLQHLSHLFYERCQLHHKHIQDIQDRHLEIQGKLYGVVINRFPDRNKRMGTLESQLFQLEQQKRDEELAFWKDTMELREKMFESAGTYQGTRQRFSLFADVEARYGKP
jgi:hypothetical protein